MSKQDLKHIIQKIAKIPLEEAKKEPKLRIAGVASIIRWRPYMDVSEKYTQTDHLSRTPTEFLNQPWVNDCHGEAEMFFIKRADRNGDSWSGHVAFPGGKDEPSDKSNLDTVVRECKEEIGIDLGSRDFLFLGSLEHLKIKSIRDDSSLTIITSVFLQVTPVTPKITIQTTEVASTYWIPLKYLLKNPITIQSPLKHVKDIAKKELPWPSNVRVPSINLLPDNENSPYLWGMTLRMTQVILGTPHSRTVITEVQPENSNNDSKL